MRKDGRDVAPEIADRLRSARLRGGDLRGLEIRDCLVDDLRIVDSLGASVSVSGALASVVVEGVDVTEHVRDVLDERHPGRREARDAMTPEEFRRAWEIIQMRWSALLETVREGPADRARASVDGEWSLVETLRHLRFAADAWLGTAVLAEPAAHHRWGLPADGTPQEFADRLGLELTAEPGLDEVLEVRASRLATFRSELDALTEDELDRVCAGTPGPGYPEREYLVRDCLRVVLTEEVEHLRYALRDLSVLAERGAHGQGGPSSPQ